MRERLRGCERMSENKKLGDLGEQDVIKKVKCPNCKKNLMILPSNYPLFDVQCVGCSFRAQVKTLNSKPKDKILGAGWEIMNKILKSGFMIPPLLVNFNWSEGQQIRFYPFIPKTNLNHYTLSKSARRANYKMFSYNNLNKIPFFIIYEKEKLK